MKAIHIAALFLAGTIAPVHAQSNIVEPALSAPMMQGSGPLIDSRSQITTPTVSPSPNPVTTPSAPQPIVPPVQSGSRAAPQIPGDMAGVLHVQQLLNQQGFITPENGIWDAQTRVSLQNFQRSRGFQATGSLDQRTVAALGIRASQTTGGSASLNVNPSGVGSTPSSIPNPSGVGSTPNSIPNPRGVGSNPNVQAGVGVGVGGNIGGSARGDINTGSGTR